MHKLHSLHFLALFAILVVAWSVNLLALGEDTYTGLLLAWYIAAAWFLASKYRNGELAYGLLHH